MPRYDRRRHREPNERDALKLGVARMIVDEAVRAIAAYLACDTAKARTMLDLSFAVIEEFESDRD